MLDGLTVCHWALAGRMTQLVDRVFAYFHVSIACKGWLSVALENLIDQVGSFQHNATLTVTSAIRYENDIVKSSVLLVKAIFVSVAPSNAWLAFPARWSQWPGCAASCFAPPSQDMLIVLLQADRRLNTSIGPAASLPCFSYFIFCASGTIRARKAACPMCSLPLGEHY